VSPVSAAAAYRHCWRIASRHYENFTVGSWLLPRRQRRHLAAIYAWARTADDLADEGTATPAERLARLDAWERALDDGLADRRDQAVAYKYIAFISCAFNRLAECEASFERAFAVDPGFSLSDKEIGHPVWGPIYRQLAATRAR